MRHRLPSSSVNNWWVSLTVLCFDTCFILLFLATTWLTTIWLYWSPAGNWVPRAIVRTKERLLKVKPSSVVLYWTALLHRTPWRISHRPSVTAERTSAHYYMRAVKPAKHPLPPLDRIFTTSCTVKEQSFLLYPNILYCYNNRLITTSNTLKHRRLTAEKDHMVHLICPYIFPLYFYLG